MGCPGGGRVHRECRRVGKAARLARSSAALLAAGPYLDALDGIVDNSSTSELEDEIAEFQELARSAGVDVVATVVQRRPRPDAATLVGEGNLEEIAGIVASTRADLLLFDHDLSPSQLRNLNNRFDFRVIDWTQLILDIFARHARTRKGQLQVELAQLEYQLPRLSGQGKAMSCAGSVVALVGYTNAGKSTLFNALTSAGVLESAKMFATFDPKLRQIGASLAPEILLSDTVGFIRNLPHTLVTSFRATLEEVERAEILLHVRDMSSPPAVEQKAEVEKVLGEQDVAQKPVIDVLNNVDRMDADEWPTFGPECCRSPSPAALVMGWRGAGGSADGGAGSGAVVSRKYCEGNLAYLSARGPTSLLGRYRRFRERDIHDVDR